jgi:inner membrane protein involved in colicin E2 resistance
MIAACFPKLFHHEKLQNSILNGANIVFIIIMVVLLTTRNTKWGVLQWYDIHTA